MRIFALLLGSLAISQGISALRAPGLPGDVSLWPNLELALGLVWLALLMTSALRVWRSARAYPQAAVLLMVFMTYQAVRLLIFARADYDRARLPFVLVAALAVNLILIFSVWRGRSRPPLDTLVEKEPHDRKRQDEHEN